MWSIYLRCVIFILFFKFSIEENDLTLAKKNKYVSIQKLVYGGTSYKITDAPYMGILFHRKMSKDVFICGACIVHERFLLTAAHCYDPNYPSFVKVGTDVIDGGIKYNIEKIIVHPRYNIGVEANNDIALIKLRTKLNFNGRVNLIEMASKVAIEPGAVMQTMGFGRTEKSESSRHLLIVQVPYVSQYVCQSKLKMINAIITNSMLCAGGVKGKDSCNGDSGGPLVYRNKLFGLVSFGYECGEELPAVYASIPALRDFVDYTIRVESHRDIYNSGVVNIFHRPWWSL